MIVVCTDGTQFRCRAFEVIEAGVALYGEHTDEDDDRYGGDKEQIGFVPHTQLLYILPDGAAPRPNPGAGAATPRSPVAQGRTPPQTGGSPGGGPPGPEGRTF